MTATTNEPRTVGLAAGVLRPQFLTDQGWRSMSEAARACGVSTSTLTRVAAGDADPGPAVIAGLITATGLPFEQLFVTR